MRGKNVLIIGGGGVGTVRAKKFLNAGANVKVLSMEFSEELKELKNERLELIKGDVYDRRLLEPLIEWANIVTVAIADLNANKFVKEISKRKKCFLNFANDSDETEVVVPFEGEFEGIRFSVTTEGKSGIVARMVRDSILDMLRKDDKVVYFLKSMEFLKRYMKSENIPVDTRMKLYFEISSDKEFRELVNKGDVAKAKELAKFLVKEYVEGRRNFKVKDNLSFG